MEIYQLNFKKFMPGIAWFFIVAVLLFLPGSDLPPTEDWLEKIYFDKWVHAGLFGIMGFLFALPVARSQSNRKKQYYIMLIIIASLWGLLTEYIQHNYVPRRSYDLGDWAADTVGVTLGIFAAVYFTKKGWDNSRVRKWLP